MAASTVTRSHWVDDDGSGTTGTLGNESELQKIFDEIDLLISGTGAYVTLSAGGNLRAEGTIGLALKGQASPAVSAAGDASIVYDNIAGIFKASFNGAALSALVPTPTLSTATGAISITIGSLDLATDQGYDFDIETTDAAGATTNSLTAQVNGSAGSADGWEGTYNRALTPSPTGGGGTGANLWEISAAQVSAKWSGRLSLRLVGAGPHPYATWHVTGLDSTGGAQNVFGVHGSGMRQSATNVTSIKFALSGSTCDWRVIVRKIKST